MSRCHRRNSSLGTLCALLMLIGLVQIVWPYLLAALAVLIVVGVVNRARTRRPTAPAPAHDLECGCEVCTAGRLTDADRSWLTAHGWLDPRR